MNKSYCCTLLPLLLAVFLLSCGGGTPVAGNNGGGASCNAQAGTTCQSLVLNGVTRTYLLHVPANFQRNAGALVIVLHGSGSNGLQMETLTGFSTLADQAGFAVAYPDGLLDASTGQSDWAYFFNDFADDVAFLRQLIPSIQANVGTDPKKVYVTGHSAGGFMAHRLGVELSDLVAGIGVVEGAISSNGSPTPVPSALGPVSVLILHGDQDNTVQYCGSRVDASQEDSFNYWTGPSGDSCSTVDTASPLCDSQGNPTGVVEKDATSCRGNTEVQFYKLIGGTHAWNTGPMNVPSQSPFNPAFDSNTGITTSEILWNFFAAHPKP
jgi:polyhydroxybutyrate depolymerase